MQNELKMQIVIDTKNEEECMRIGTLIHTQLMGNPDYVNDNIILNCTQGDNKVRLWIFEECEKVPHITI